MRVIHPTLLLILLAACGDDGTTHPAIDAPIQTHDAAPDGRTLDAPIDAPATRQAQVAVVESTTPNGDDAQISVSVVAGSVYGTVVGSDGPCTAYTGDDGGIHYSAGVVNVTGTTVPYTSTPSGAPPDVQYTTTPNEALPLYAAGATIAVSAAGSSDFPAFAGTMTAPHALAGFAAPTTVSRAGYTATWTAASGAAKIWVILVGLHGSQTGILVCRVDDTGSYSVQASAFALFPAAFDMADVALARVSETLLASPDVSMVAVNEIVGDLVPLTQ